MEVFIGQPDLLDVNLSWLQDAEIELRCRYPFIAVHIPITQNEMFVVFFKMILNLFDGHIKLSLCTLGFHFISF